MTQMQRELLYSIDTSTLTKCDIRLLNHLIGTFPLWHTMDIGRLLCARAVQRWCRTHDVDVDVRSLQRVVSAIVQCRPGLEEEGFDDEITPILPHVTGELRPPKSACSFFENAFVPDNNKEEVTYQWHDYLTMQKGLSSLHRRQMWDALVNLLHCARVSFFEKNRVRPTLAQCLQYVTGPVVLNFLVGLAHKSVINTWNHATTPSIVVRHIVAINHARAVGLLPNLQCNICRKHVMSIAHGMRGSMNRLIDVRALHGRKTYNADEIKQLYNVCKSAKDRLLLLLLSRVGLRNTALRSLMVHNVCHDHGIAMEKGQRLHQFHIDAETHRTFTDYIATEHPNIVGKLRSQYVFPYVNSSTHCVDVDSCMSPKQLHRWLQLLARRAGVQGCHVTIHSFRRYVVTALMQDGYNSIEHVARFVGHQSPATTQRYWLTDPHLLTKQLKLPWSE